MAYLKLLNKLLNIKHRKGFILVELIIVIIIIGILSIVAVPIYQYRVEKAKLTEAYAMLRSIADANVAYYLENGKYASNINLLDIEIGKSARVSSLNRIETEHFVYSAAGTGDSNIIALAQRVPFAKKYYVYIMQTSLPDSTEHHLGTYKIGAHSYNGCSIIDKQIVAEINKKQRF